MSCVSHDRYVIEGHDIDCEQELIRINLLRQRHALWLCRTKSATFTAGACSA